MAHNYTKQFNKSFTDARFKILVLSKSINHTRMMKLYIRALFIVIIFLFVLPDTINSQDINSNLVNNYSYNFNYRLNKKTKLHAGQLLCFRSDANQLKYTQFKIGISHRILRNISMNILYKPMLFKGRTQNLWYHQLSSSVTHRSKLFSLPFKNAITVDFFSPKLKKYKLRFIYTAKYSFKNKFMPLRATPYIKFQMYYYQNGKPINYYGFGDDDSDLLARNSPNGFHRFRLGIGIRFRPIKHFYISIYYTLQEEFNTALSENRELNIWNNKQTKIINPFNNYEVLGLSFSYSIPKIGR